jgi:hypothetical protein
MVEARVRRLIVWARPMKFNRLRSIEPRGLKPAFPDGVAKLACPPPMRAISAPNPTATEYLFDSSI